MNTHKKITCNSIALIVITVLLAPLLPHSDAFAIRKPRPPVKRIHYYPIRVLPRGFITIHLTGIPYFFHHGIFYKKHRAGFVVIPPPRNIIVPALPLGHKVVVAGGITYYVFGDVYYRKVPKGFMVAETPVPAPVQPSVLVDEQKVTVTASMLNVRSGPGLEHSILFQVSNGTILSVFGNAPDWYYVRLPDGYFGWVMAKFTKKLPPPAEG